MCVNAGVSVVGDCDEKAVVGSYIFGFNVVNVVEWRCCQYIGYNVADNIMAIWWI